MGIERRVAQRLPVGFSVYYNYEPPSLVRRQTHVLNLSLVGVKAECYASLIPGASIAFHIITPEHRVMDVRGRVIYIEPDEQPPYRVGIQFTAINHLDQAILENELARLTAS